MFQSIKRNWSIFLYGTVTVLQLHSHLKYLIVRFQNKLVTLSMNADLLDVHLASCHPNVVKSVNYKNQSRIRIVIPAQIWLLLPTSEWPWCFMQINRRGNARRTGPADFSAHGFFVNILHGVLSRPILYLSPHLLSFLSDNRPRW